MILHWFGGYVSRFFLREGVFSLVLRIQLNHPQQCYVNFVLLQYLECSWVAFPYMDHVLCTCDSSRCKCIIY